MDLCVQDACGSACWVWMTLAVDSVDHQWWTTLITRWWTALITRWWTALITRWTTLITRWWTTLITRWWTTLITRWWTALIKTSEGDNVRCRVPVVGSAAGVWIDCVAVTVTT